MSLERVGHTTPLAQEGDRLIHHRDKVHAHLLPASCWASVCMCECIIASVTGSVLKETQGGKLWMWCGATLLGFCITHLVSRLPSQLFQQDLRVLKVGRVKALREPAIDRGQQLTGSGTLALALPQPTQAYGRPQL